MTEDKYKELLRLSVECFQSLRRKYPARVRWTPEREAWRSFLEKEQGGKLEGLAYYTLSPPPKV